MLFKNLLKRATLFVALGVLIVFTSAPVRGSTTTVIGQEGIPMVVHDPVFVRALHSITVTIAGIPDSSTVDPSNPAYWTVPGNCCSYYDSVSVYFTPSMCDAGEQTWLFHLVEKQSDSTPSPSGDKVDTFYVVIQNINRPPAFPQVSDTIIEYTNHSGEVTYEAKDPDADTCNDDAIVYTADSLPPRTFSTTGSSVTLNWSNIPAGSYNTKVMATDNSGASDTLNVHFDVRQPTIEMRGDSVLQVNEGSSLAFNAWAKAMTNGEVDSSLTVVLKVDSLPPGAIPSPDDSVTSLGQVTIPISWDPGYCSAGDYQVKYTAKIYCDSSLLEQKVTRETVTAINVNRVPSVFHSGPDSLAVYQGQPVNVHVTSFDPDVSECSDDAIVLSVQNKPLSATLTDSGNGSGAFSWNTKGNPKGTSSFLFITTDNSGNSDTAAMKVTLLPTGDANGDGNVNLADIIYLVNYIFKGGPPSTPLEAMDANCDGKVNLTDIIYLVNYIFKGGAAPCPAG